MSSRPSLLRAVVSRRHRAPRAPQRHTPPSRRARASFARRGGGLGLLVPCAAALFWAGCSGSTVDPRLRVPSLHFDAGALTLLANVAARLERTPLGEAAARAAALAAGCDDVFAVAVSDPLGDADAPSEADPMKAPLACADGAPDPDHAAWARDRRGDADGWAAWPLGADGHVELHARVDEAGGLSISGVVHPPRDRDVLSLLWPDTDPPHASVFDPTRLLVHARARPHQGLGLARLLPTGGQADRLFALKGRLLEGALLAGTWEIAFVAPSDGGRRALPVAAVHHRNGDAIRTALDEALDQIEATWPIERSRRTFALADGASAPGGCYAELPLLPELAPCWIVTGNALVVGYRADAVEAAIGRPAVSIGSATGTGARGTHLTADLAALDRLDRAGGPPGETDATPAKDGPIRPGALYQRVELTLLPADDGRFDLSARVVRTAP